MFSTGVGFVLHCVTLKDLLSMQYIRMSGACGCFMRKLNIFDVYVIA